MRDVLVVGSGHNALIAACYLAADGWDVEVIERDTVVGGAVSTTQRWPGFHVDRGSSLHVMIRFTGIIEELALAECGLTYLDVDPWAFAPFWQGPPGQSEQVALTFHTDLGRTCASIEAVCGARDADAYEAFARDWAGRNERIFAYFQQPPSPGNAMRHFLGIGRAAGSRDGAELGRQFMLPADALLDEHFTDERLKTALAWLGAQSGPPTHEPITADLMAWVALLHTRSPGRPVGGSGALTAALLTRLQRSGGTIRLGDGAAGIVRRSGRVVGIITESGDEVRARRVIAGCHISETLRLLADPHWLARGRAIRLGNGIGIAVRLATTGLPEYPSAPPPRTRRLGTQPIPVSDAHVGMQLLVPDRSFLRAAYADYLAGRIPQDPAVLAMSFSAIDPSLAPAGHHTLTLWAQWHPYRLRSGQWPAQAEAAGAAVIDVLDRAAPGFREKVTDVHVQTPDRLESELGLRHGNVMHVEMTPESSFWWRPLPELSGYATPVPGLFLTGASTHPGGGVFGASGRSCARVVGRSLRRARPPRPVRGAAAPGSR